VLRERRRDVGASIARHCLRNIPMAHKREDTPDRYPGPSFYDEAYGWLLDSRKDGEIHIPTFAQHILEQLRDIGLLHTTDAEPPENVRKVRLTKGDKVQDLWLRLDTIRDPRGYLTVEVVGAPRSDAAILAAMVARATEPIDFDQVLLAMEGCLPGSGGRRPHGEGGASVQA
jgi:hypothetical protein